MKVKWTTLGMVVFLLLSVVMTGCFIWQYRIPKMRTGNAPDPPRPWEPGTLLLEPVLEQDPFGGEALGVVGLHKDGNRSRLGR